MVVRGSTRLRVERADHALATVLVMVRHESIEPTCCLRALTTFQPDPDELETEGKLEEPDGSAWHAAQG